MFSRYETKPRNSGSIFKRTWLGVRFWRLRISPALMVVALAAIPRLMQAAEGDLDPSFGNGGKVTVQIAADERDFALAVAVQPDGKILVGGELGDFSANYNSAVLVRLNPNGSLDPTFGTGGKVVNQGQLHLPAMVIQPDGKIVTAAATAIQGINLNFVAARYNPDGSLDQSFGNGGYAVNGEGTANWVLLQPDGKIVLIGTVAIFRNGSDFVLARFNTDGTPDQSFGNGGRLTTSLTEGRNSSDVAASGVLQSDGKIVVSGSIGCISVALVRYNSDGTIDNGFGLDGNVLTPNFGGNASRIVVQPDGKLVIGGGPFVLGRYNSDGRIDHSFGVNGQISGGFGSGNGSLHALAIDAAGRFLAAGSVSYTGTGNAVFTLARYTTDGFPDPAFGNNGFVLTSLTGCLDEAFAVGLQTDGKVILTGYRAEPGCSYHDIALTRHLALTPVRKR